MIGLCSQQLSNNSGEHSAPHPSTLLSSVSICFPVRNSQSFFFLLHATVRAFDGELSSSSAKFCWVSYELWFDLKFDKKIGWEVDQDKEKLFNYFAQSFVQFGRSAWDEVNSWHLLVLMPSPSLWPCSSIYVIINENQSKWHLRAHRLRLKNQKTLLDGHKVEAPTSFSCSG